MTKLTATITATSFILAMCAGCMSRFLREGVGTVRGASAAVVQGSGGRDLSTYQNLQIQTFTVSSSLPAASRMPSLIHESLLATARKRGFLESQEGPGLRLTGQIVHYETASAVDNVVGPLEEVVVHAILTDAQTGEQVGEANLVGRAKATTASGDQNLAAGVAKAFDEWLEKRGMK